MSDPGAANGDILDLKSLRIQVKTDAGDGTVLVNDVSLALRRGEVVGLIGESGSGKSMIGLASMGYTRRGCAIVGGEIVFGKRIALGKFCNVRKPRLLKGALYISE